MTLDEFRKAKAMSGVGGVGSPGADGGEEEDEERRKRKAAIKKKKKKKKKKKMLARLSFAGADDEDGENAARGAAASAAAAAALAASPNAVRWRRSSVVGEVLLADAGGWGRSCAHRATFGVSPLL